MSIRIIVADDVHFIQMGLGSLFLDTEIKVVGFASTREEVVAQTLKLAPDVLLLDIRLPYPTYGGLDALEELREHSVKTKVIMMSAHDNPTCLARSLALGADGFVLKDASGKEIIAAVQHAQRGEADCFLSEIRTLLATRRDPAADDVPLTKREYQVLRHMAYGLSNREIGRLLKISIETVKEHVQNILRKLDAADRTEAAVWAVKRGLV
jgi:DNA-binding NarL/FixJ family response regulator